MITNSLWYYYTSGTRKLQENMASTLYFDAETYALVESRETIQRNGEEILVGYHREMVSEVLPAGTPVVWDFSDLEGVTVVDEELPPRRPK